MQWIFVLCGCMFLLSLIATYQVCTVSLKAGLYTYNAVEPTASSFGFATLRLRFRRRLTAGVRRLWRGRKTNPPFRLGDLPTQQEEGIWQKDKSNGYIVRPDRPSRK